MYNPSMSDQLSSALPGAFRSWLSGEKRKYNRQECNRDYKPNRICLLSSGYKCSQYRYTDGSLGLNRTPNIKTSIILTGGTVSSLG